jgi:hypothetical protein
VGSLRDASVLPRLSLFNSLPHCARPPIHCCAAFPPSLPPSFVPLRASSFLCSFIHFRRRAVGCRTLAPDRRLLAHVSFHRSLRCFFSHFCALLLSSHFSFLASSLFCFSFDIVTGAAEPASAHGKVICIHISGVIIGEGGSFVPLAQDHSS